jgi:hypothetical protein
MRTQQGVFACGCCANQRSRVAVLHRPDQLEENSQRAASGHVMAGGARGGDVHR